ncbi:cereblon family protein [Megalodesulfovibrio paquesii]
MKCRWVPQCRPPRTPPGVPWRIPEDPPGDGRDEAGQRPTTGQGSAFFQEKPLRCRRCNAPVTSRDAAVEVSGRHAHVCCNPAGLVFEIRCFAMAKGCAAIGLPSSAFTWFARYSWQISVCRQCRAHLGWKFTGPTQFFGLIVDRLIE